MAALLRLALLITGAASLVSAQSLSVNTPTGVRTCEPTRLLWSGGNSPFFVSILAGGDPTGAALVSLGPFNDAGATWNANLPSGNQYVLAVVDSVGLQAFSAPFPISPGSSTGCLGGAGGEAEESPSLSRSSAGTTNTPPPSDTSTRNPQETNSDAGSTPTTTDTGPTQEANPRRTSNNTGTIVGGVVGGLGGLALVVVAFLIWRRRQRHAEWNKHADFTAPSASTPSITTQSGPSLTIRTGTGPPPSVQTTSAFGGAGALIYPSEKSLPAVPHHQVPPPSMPEDFNPYAGLDATSSSSLPGGNLRPTRAATLLEQRAVPERQLTPEETEYVHRLYRANVPAHVVAGLIGRMMAGDADGSEMPSISTLVDGGEGKKLPPAYDSIPRK